MQACVVCPICPSGVAGSSCHTGGIDQPIKFGYNSEKHALIDKTLLVKRSLAEVLHTSRRTRRIRSRVSLEQKHSIQKSFRVRVQFALSGLRVLTPINNSHTDQVKCIQYNHQNKISLSKAQYTKKLNVAIIFRSFAL